MREKKVLVVDDDVRNIFALGSVLERHGMKVIAAQTGREAATTLENTPDIAIVLSHMRRVVRSAQIFSQDRKRKIFGPQRCSRP